MSKPPMDETDARTELNQLFVPFTSARHTERGYEVSAWEGDGPRLPAVISEDSFEDAIKELKKRSPERLRQP